MKGVTDALFLVVQNFHNRTENKNECWGNTTGCIIYYSVVCCEGTLCPHKHTLRVYYIHLRGCFSVCFSLRLWKAVNDEQA